MLDKLCFTDLHPIIDKSVLHSEPTYVTMPNPRGIPDQIMWQRSLISGDVYYELNTSLLINYNTGMSGTTAFIVYICGLHVSTYTQVIFRPSCTRESIKSYARWDPIVLTSLKHNNYIKCFCLSIKVKIRIAVFYRN